MADELGHLSAEIALDINPFLTNQRVLEAQIKRTGNLLNTMESSFKTSSSNLGANSIFKTQIAQLGMLDKQLQNYQRRFEQAKADLSANPSVENQRAYGTTATQLQNTALKYDQLRLAAARTLQQQRAASSVFGRGSAMIGDYGNKLQSVATSIRGFGSTIGSAAIGGGLYNAAKAAMTFKSEIQGIGPLLSDDGRITAQVTQQLNQMSQSSLKWSQQYGISTNEINNAMTELVRRGFTAQQTLGSMPAILNASRASGESLGTVMQASASAIEMFGLKANSTAEQIKNTNRVTDVLTVAANKTASSFADISAAMTYVGPTAAQAHMSIEQVAAAIGALSNRGIEASTAGTTLRQVLSKLTTDTKGNRANMKAIGVDIDEIKRKGVDLPKLIDQINNKLKDKTPTEKMALLNAAFGKLGQGVMALFTKSNKASKSAGAELRDLETELEHAGGTTKRIADQMNNTPQAKWERFKQTMHATMIEIGGNVLPAMEGLMKSVSSLAEAFGKLPSSQQKAIVEFLAFSAAIKPLSSLIAAPISGLGKLENAFKKFYDVGARIKGGSLKSSISEIDQLISKAKGVGSAAGSFKKLGDASISVKNSASGMLSTMSTVVGATEKIGPAGAKAASSVAEMGSAASAAAGTTATFGSSLASTAIGLGIVAGAVLAGVGAWKLYTGVIQPAIAKKQEDERETRLWGQTVGSETQKSIDSFRRWSTQAKDAMNNTSYTAQESTSKIKEAFEGMSKAIDSSNEKQQSAMSKLAKSLGGTVSSQIGQWQKEDEKATDDWKDRLQFDQDLATKITSKASNERRKLTEDEKIMLNNIQNDMTMGFVASLGVTKSAADNIQKALSNTFNHKLSAGAFKESLEDITNALRDTGKESGQYKQKMKEVQDAENQGILSHSRAAALRKQIDTDDFNNRESLLEAEMNLMKNQGKSYKEIESEIRKQFAGWGIKWDQSAFDQAMNHVKSKTHEIKSTLADVSNNMSKDAQDAGNAWNSLVLDPKTGEIKTNAKQSVIEFGKTKKGWEDLKFIAKNAHIGSNGKAMIVEAAFANGQWNKMKFKDQVALMATKGGQDLATGLNKINQWNGLNPKIQELIASSPDMDTMIQSIVQLDQWNSIDPQAKSFILDSAGAKSNALAGIASLKEWNTLPTNVKQLIAKNFAGQGTVPALQQLGVWNKLPSNIKNLLVKNMTAKDADPALTKLKGWNKLSTNQKKLAAQDYASGKTKKATSEVAKWAKKSPGKAKNLKANNHASSPAKQALRDVEAFQYKAHDKTVTLTTKYVTVHIDKHEKKATGTAGAWRFKHFAYGTPEDGWQGGPVVVGDGHRREVVNDPKLGLFTTPATDTVMNLSKGATIWRSVEAFENAMWHAGIKDYPHFANGNAGKNLVAVADRIPDDTEERLAEITSNSTPNHQSNELQMQTNDLLATLIEQQQRMSEAIAGLNLILNVDGKKLADTQAEPNAKAINNYLKQLGMRLS